MKVYIACDHRGVDLKQEIINYLKENNINVLEIGLNNTPTDDYPDFAFRLGNLVINNEDSLGILICGNGIGISIAANKVKGIRCGRVVSVDDAIKAKEHNGANVIALGADTTISLAKDIVDAFLNTKSVNEERHLNRVNKIIKYENGEYNEL